MATATTEEWKKAWHDLIDAAALHGEGVLNGLYCSLTGGDLIVRNYGKERDPNVGMCKLSMEEPTKVESELDERFRKLLGD